MWDISVLEKLRQYNPYGPKGPVASYSMGNKLLAFFESVDKEAVKKYSFALGRILDFMIISNQFKRLKKFFHYIIQIL